MENRSPGDVYRDQVQKHSTVLNALLKKKNLFGWLRLAIFLVTIIVSYRVFADAGLMGLLPLLIGMTTFIYLVVVDTNNNNAITNIKTLIRINEEEIRILNNDYAHRYDGSGFSPAVHDYASDLDLFGEASIFQWASRCSSEQGKKLFAANLLHPLPVERARERQEAIMELAPLLEWRQQFQSYSGQTVITQATETKTIDWLVEDEKHFTGKLWKGFVRVYTLLTLSSVAAVLLGYIPSGVFLFLFGLYFFVSMFLSRKTIGAYLQLSRIVEEIGTVENLIKWMEDENFRSVLLKSWKQNIRSGEENASVQIRQLRSILDRFDLRLNLVGPLFLNSFLLWDIRQMMALNQWRQRNRQVVPKLFEVIAETEVLVSLATIHLNYPGWCFPTLADEHFVFESSDLGHPLIPEAGRVNNSFRVQTTTLISVVTGSNMAGKSTFLRSIGVNMVLAQMGAPACAKSLRLSPVRLMTSMRIADNLAENTSTFYAELKKLKTIIEAVNRHEHVFILLDEILRGTNSHDRHTGSAAFIKQLIRQHAYAVIATHDLELAELEKQYPGALENYHFDVQVKGEELFFDYQLKEGVCHSLNASLLMKKIGIELQD